ncbi:TRPM8 channel-associated factor homolog [Parambassis ranga]|uniref:TRPM8 channel-associated factor homolog n=1 Tax=Parambassis ranga TaxID=210632 RepID=A0A6P7JDW7_9TELE|nr:TRPM8 channel-associated factor homolog [Parambassis ranga]
MSQPTKSWATEAYTSLTKGLKEVDLCGPCVPCNLVLIGDYAFPLVMNSQGQVLMAASVYGRGRIVVLGHEAYLTTCSNLVENAVIWLKGEGSDNLSVGVHKSVKAVANTLSKSTFQAEVVKAFSDNVEVGVYVTDAYSIGADVKELVAYMKAGGGVLIAGQAWSWAGNHPKENTFLQFPGNKVSSVAGVYFTDCYGERERLPVYPEIPFNWKTLRVGKDFRDDLETLLQGISKFDLQDGVLASEVLVHGTLAFPIGTTESGRAFLAGAYYGQGRVIVITHEGLLGQETLVPVWKNAVRWLDEGRNGAVGVVPQLEAACNLFQKSGITSEKTKFRKDLSVFVCTAYSDDYVEEIHDFVAQGGGLLIGGHAWYWAETHSGQNLLTDFTGNKILNKMGLSLLENTIKEGSYKAPVLSQTIKDTYHFRHLLQRFAGHVYEGQKLTERDEECLKKLGGDCANFLRMQAYSCSSYTQVVSTLTNVLKKSGMPQVSESCPVKRPTDHLLLSVGTEVYKICSNPDALLPYLIKDNPLMPVSYNHRVKLQINTAGGKEWVSTGLYLSPGMKTYIAIPAEIVNKGWQVQIGCQTDQLNAEELKRAPRVHDQFPVTAEMMQVWNLWGGLIYLVAPPNAQVQEAEVIVQMAVPAPYYKSGVTTAADWARLRTAPSPWAELEFDNIILTVPSDVVRGLEHPDKLAESWNNIMRGIADLAVIPHKFPRKERFVTDVQISYGWMHAGYPVMAHTAAAVDLVSIDPKKRDLWGAIHELGHNQQRGCWEFPPHTTECTCNLWSVYVHEEVLGINRAKAHPDMTLEKRQSRAKEYAKGGKKLSNWKVWVALETYLQLQDRFGWDAFKKVFAAYHKMSNFPGDNKGKMNLYAQTFSQTVGMNLAAFFKAWGWPIETATEQKLSNLPQWRDHPMVQYD